MINHLHALFHRPERGWDPIPATYAAQYTEIQWGQGVKESLLDELECWVGGLSGKRVLDLGGGPGHYSVAFAKRNADVTWHDVSRTYREVAEMKAINEKVHIQFSIGYMDAAAKLHCEPFDLVFSRVCWNYGLSDHSFADAFFDLIKPGGVGYVDAMHSGARDPNSSWSVLIRTWLNQQFAIKIGHPMPPHGRIAKLFMKKPITKMLVDYSSPLNDRITFVKQTNPDTSPK
jgi:2-polyprenyl-3-methyl-5-hydroxy-6-metoxy-1,4-benzoquinol methylase